MRAALVTMVLAIVFGVAVTGHAADDQPQSTTGDQQKPATGDQQKPTAGDQQKPTAGDQQNAAVGEEQAPPVADGTHEEPPCLADARRLCYLVPPTGSFVQGCLEMHGEDLSPGCRKNVGRYTQDTETVRAACDGDLARLCSDVGLHPSDHAGCLIAHRDALSPRCRETIEKVSRQ
jgi:hypothetical protein